MSDLLALGCGDSARVSIRPTSSPALPNRARLVAYSACLDGPTIQKNLQLEVLSPTSPTWPSLSASPRRGERRSRLGSHSPPGSHEGLLRCAWPWSSGSTKRGRRLDLGRGPSGPTFADLSAAATSLCRPLSLGFLIGLGTLQLASLLLVPGPGDQVRIVHLVERHPLHGAPPWATSASSRGRAAGPHCPISGGHGAPRGAGTLGPARQVCEHLLDQVVALSSWSTWYSRSA